MSGVLVKWTDERGRQWKAWVPLTLNLAYTLARGRTP